MYVCLNTNIIIARILLLLRPPRQPCLRPASRNRMRGCAAGTRKSNDARLNMELYDKKENLGRKITRLKGFAESG